MVVAAQPMVEACPGGGGTGGGSGGGSDKARACEVLQMPACIARMQLMVYSGGEPPTCSRLPASSDLLAVELKKGARSVIRCAR